MGFIKFSPKLVIGILLAISFLAALSIRIFLPYDQVFGADWIKFTSIDAYTQMRLVDNLVHNFPILTNFDPYAIYPGGSAINNIHFFNWFLAGITWVIGLGSPSEHTVDVIGVYFPTVLAALTVIPVYFIGKTLFNRWAGVIAAALLAVMPGEYLGRSFLGFTDHHVAETLLSTTVILFLILAISTARQRGLALSHLRNRDWAVITRPLVYSALAGFFLGIYLITWVGGLLMVFIISLYLAIQYIIDHLRHQTTDYPGVIGFITLLVATVIVLSFSQDKIFYISLSFALLIPVVLLVTSRMMERWRWKAAYYPLILAGIGVVVLAAFYGINAGAFAQVMGKFEIFAPTGATATTTLEMQPFLSPQGSFSTLVAWGNYTTSFFLVEKWPIPGFALISFVALIWLFIKRRHDEKHLLLFLIWSLTMLVLTLVQRRFAYYLVVNVVLLSAYLSWQAIWYSGLRKLAHKPEPVAKEAKAKVKHKESRGITIYHLNTILAVLVVLTFVFLFNIIKSLETAAQPRFAPSDAWQSSLMWMRENTPEPFGDADAYYRIYERPPRGEHFKYPESAYGVLSWWDFGYWITRIAHRMPNANPSQDPAPIRRVADFFLSQDESSARSLVEEMDSAYVVIDHAMITTKFWAIVTWSDIESSKFNETYYLPYEGKFVPINLFYPAYYSSTIARLYNFDGKAVTAESPMVVTYAEKADREGNRYKQITDMEQFTSYREALDFVESNGADNHRIVGINPFISPIPLEAVQDYKLVHSSETGISYEDLGLIPEVKVFEYIR